jgi:hypothetical protein
LGLTLFLVFNVVFGIDTSAAPDVNSPEITSKMGEIKTYISEIFKLPIATLLISFVFYFIGGYFLYSSLYAAIGSAVDNETDSQQFLLPKKEFDLLYLLASNTQKVFKRDEILEKVWGNDVIVGERTIDVHIRRLREKLGIDTIQTLKGIGYKLVV